MFGSEIWYFVVVLLGMMMLDGGLREGGENCLIEVSSSLPSK